MAKLRSLFLAAVHFLASPATAGPVDRWSSHITEASARFGVPQEWIRRVILAESGGRTMQAGRPITSRAGAMGLMQLMPGTWADMRARHGLGPDPHDPRDNILAGTAYLRAMHDRFGYPGLLAAYNAGPARYADHLATGHRLPRETLAYVASVGRVRLGTSTGRQEQFPDRSVFVSLAGAQLPNAGSAPPPAAAASLFVPLSTSSEPPR